MEETAAEAQERAVQHQQKMQVNPPDIQPVRPAPERGSAPVQMLHACSACKRLCLSSEDQWAAVGSRGCKRGAVCDAGKQEGSRRSRGHRSIPGRQQPGAPPSCNATHCSTAHPDADIAAQWCIAGHRRNSLPRAWLSPSWAASTQF